MGKNKRTKSNDPLTTCRYIVGVDPGVNTGYAEFDRVEKTWELLTLDFWTVFERLRVRVDVFVVIENPADIRPVFERYGVRGKSQLRVAQNVGGVKREAQLLIDGLKRCDIPVAPVAPVRAQKWTAEDIRRILGISARSSEHARDAARLAHKYALVPLQTDTD